MYLLLFSFNLHIAYCTIEVDQSKYDKGVKWLQEFLYAVQFNEERIRIVAQRLANSAAQQKRNGDQVANSLLTYLVYEKMSVPTLESLLYMEKSMNKVLKELNLEPEQVSDLSFISKFFCFAIFLLL